MKATKIALAILLIALLIIICIVIRPKVTASYDTLSIVIGGDVMLDRHIRKLGQQNGYDSLFKNVAPLFMQADISIINLEGPITSSSSKTLLPDGKTTNSFFFTFDPISAKAIKNAGINIVSLANNHTDNFFRKGLDETKYYLSEQDIAWFGDPSNLENTEYIACKRNLLIDEPFCVALVGYHEFQQGFERVLADVTRLSKDYPVIVYAHWGEEYSGEPEERVKEKARYFVESGASLVIGTHPHVVQGHEYVAGIPVIYSLGNLVFDQYFNEEVMKGNIAEIKLTRDDDGIMINSVKLHEISNKEKLGPKLTGQIIELKR